MLNETSLSELRTKLAKYLEDLFGIDGVFNVYELRKFFEFRHIADQGEQERASSTYRKDSVRMSAENKISLLSDYFPGEGKE